MGVNFFLASRGRRLGPPSTSSSPATTPAALRDHFHEVETVDDGRLFLSERWTIHQTDGRTCGLVNVEPTSWFWRRREWLERQYSIGW